MRGIVACVHPRAAEEGAKILEAGGNAFDAAIATAFVQMSVLPFSCGVAGMMSAHLFSPHQNRHLVIDGCLRAGSLASESMWSGDYLGETEVSGSSQFEDFRSTMGYSSICVPGTMAVLGDLHSKFSTMKWSELVKPSIDMARNGIAVTPQLERNLTPGASIEYEPDINSRVKANINAAAIFLEKNGNHRKAGQVIPTPDFADTLERISRAGPSDFYKGELANVIVNDLESNGSFVTREDFYQYKTKIYKPVSTLYSGYEVFSNSAPGGGPLLIEALNVFQKLGVSSMDHGGTEYLQNLAPILQLVNQDRVDFLGDPDVIGYESLQQIISQDRATAISELITQGSLGAANSYPEDTDTTHLIVVDERGNVATITHSLGNVSGVVTPGLGFVYNNGMNRFDPREGRAGSIGPGKARIHLMMPSMAFKDGLVKVVFGAPGGNAILSALVQVFTNVVDFGMTAVEAVTAPRIHAESDKVWCEATIRSDLVNQLKNQGHQVHHDAASLSDNQARAQLVVIDKDLNFDGASDPRGPMGLVHSKN